MKVFDGPFKGMRYINESFGSVFAPKLMGIYEKELIEVISQILILPFDLIIDIGAAEGYYAVGVAKFHISKPKVVAYEVSPDARNLLTELARVNEVESQISVHGECTPELLSTSLVGNRILVICDAEGAEGTILDPTKVEALSNAHILVEVHKRKCPGIENALHSRFGDTHSITEIHQTERTKADFPFRGLLYPICPTVYVENCVNEFRQPWEETMVWYWMEPKHSNQSN